MTIPRFLPSPHLVGVALASLLAACDPPSPEPPVESGYVETGDLDALRGRGKARVARVPRAHLDGAPLLHWNSPHAEEVAHAFAARLGLDLEIRDVASEAEAVQALLAGRVDAIVGRKGAGLASPPGGVALSVTFREEPGVFVSRRGAAPASLDDLSGRVVTFGREDGMVGFGGAIVQANPDVRVDTLEAATVEDVLERMVAGDIDVTLAERWVAEAVLENHPELETGLEFGTVRYGAAVRASNPELLRVLDDFAFDVLPVGLDAPPLHGDLDSIRTRRVLRVLTVNGPSSYYVRQGDVVGFDLELMRMFAREQNLIPQMVVVPSVDELVPWLREGRGDVVGAGVVPGVMGATPGVRFTREYHEVRPVLVARRSAGIATERDVAGRRVVVAWNSPYLPVLEARRDSLGFELILTPDAESVHQILDRLEAGEAEVTVLPSHLAEAELPGRDSLEVVHRYDEIPGRSWAVRSNQPELLAELDAFFDREVHQLTYAVLERKYFRPGTRRAQQPDLPEDGRISPWDDLIRRESSAVDLDWRLVAAQMFAESRFDPSAQSVVGALGLMQMMPATAQQMGVRDIQDPEEQIRAGVQYLAWLRDRLPSHLEVSDRLAFAFAAYNAGFGHVRDARQVAESMGLDGDRWFDHVELAMLDLSDPDVYRQTRHGYVNGHEPVAYVRRIFELGQMYTRLVPQ